MASKNDLNVLVVDDEKRLTDMIVETFKTFPVFKSVLPSYDGTDAIRKISNQKFDIIILDLGMPKKGGLEVLDFIEKEEESHQCKDASILIISGGFTADNVSEARNHTKYFLAKPFKIKDLKLKIGEILKAEKKAS